MAEKKKKYINEKTGQIKTDLSNDISRGTDKNYKEYTPSKQTFSIGDQTFDNLKDYESAKRKAGFIESTYKNPQNILTIPAGEKTPEQMKILADVALKSGLSAPQITTEEQAELQNTFQVQEEQPSAIKQGIADLYSGDVPIIRNLPEGVKQFAGAGLATTGAVAAGALASAGAVATAPIAWRVGGQLITRASAALRAGTASKNSSLIATPLNKIATFIITAYAGLKGLESLASYFTGRKIDEQQQALNTLGQMATTIGGQATEGTGDWGKGLKELRYLRSEVLRLESAIKAGSISSAAIKFNGKIYDINADISDQIATIDEQISIVTAFALSGKYPQLSEFEMQLMLRELENEGYVEPVFDVTSSRRPT